MTYHALLIDFGASRIKSILIRLDDGAIQSQYFSQGSSHFGKKISSIFFANSLVEHLRQAYKIAKVAAIMMCCEMHGFVRPSNNSSEREYISWRYSSPNQDLTISTLEEKGLKD